MSVTQYLHKYKIFDEISKRELRVKLICFYLEKYFPKIDINELPETHFHIIVCYVDY